MIQAILFDLDGLMVDSEPHSIASWQAVLGRRGVAFDQTTLDSILGLRLSETAQLAIDRFHLPDQPADLAREKTEYQIAHLDGNVKPMSGLIELLDDIDRCSLRKAIASSGLRHYVMAVLKTVGLTSRFDVIVTGDDVINGKPAPDVFLKGAEALHIEPQACLVLEDAPAGIQAAKAAGMVCIAVPNEHTRRLDLSLADEVLPSLSAVRDRLPALVQSRCDARLHFTRYSLLVMRLGILGGTFDPPHLGHLQMAEAALTQLHLDKVLFAPAGQQPLRQDESHTPPEHRTHMVELAIVDHAQFELSRIDLDRPGPHYTVDLLAEIQHRYPSAALWFIMGEDALADLLRWRDPARLIMLARLAVLRRREHQPDWLAFDAALPGLRARIDWIDHDYIDIAATEIRQRVCGGLSIDHLVPHAVTEYIVEHHLYRE